MAAGHPVDPTHGRSGDIHRGHLRNVLGTFILSAGVLVVIGKCNQMFIGGCFGVYWLLFVDKVWDLMLNIDV